MILESLLSTSFRLASRMLLHLQPVSQQKIPRAASTEPLMLYAHIPFCESLCPYCSFNRFVFDETELTSIR